jgi:mono/diheme cytochrome c family protein
MGAMVMLLACSRGTDADAPHPHSGAELYQISCSSCHGIDARGNGPVAAFINVRVPDLTLIAVRRGGKFPADEVYRIIDGQADMPAHGERHMPVWGYEFFGMEGDDETAHQQATDKVERLVKFLSTLQRTQ